MICFNSVKTSDIQKSISWLVKTVQMETMMIPTKIYIHLRLHHSAKKGTSTFTGLDKKFCRDQSRSSAMTVNCFWLLSTVWPLYGLWMSLSTIPVQYYIQSWSCDFDILCDSAFKCMHVMITFAVENNLPVYLRNIISTLSIRQCWQPEINWKWSSDLIVCNP